jgi:hypothetical protein
MTGSMLDRPGDEVQRKKADGLGQAIRPLHGAFDYAKCMRYFCKQLWSWTLSGGFP